MTPPPLEPELRPVFGGEEKFAERERRTRAAVVLENEEVLIWWAMERNEVCVCVCVCVLMSSFTTIIVTGVSLVLSIPTSLRCFDALFTYFEKKKEKNSEGGMETLLFSFC